MTERKGIRGWLLIPALFTGVISLLFLVYFIVRGPDLFSLLNHLERFPVLDRVGIIGEMIVIICSGAFSFISLYLLGCKSKFYPKFSILLLALILFGGMIDLIYAATAGKKHWSVSDIMNIVGVFSFTAVWTLYMWRSQRVKNTFVR